MKPHTRRAFLARSTTTTVGLTLAGLSVRSVLGANERPNIALIGCGGRGSYVARGIAAAGGNITHLCDLNPAKAQSVSKFLTRFAPDFDAGRVKTVTEMERVLDEPSVDAAIVATPDHWHALATIRAVQAGKDVYVEKPHSHNIVESRKMIEAARRYDRLIQVGTQNRSGAYNFGARDYVRSGKLGKIHLVKVFNLKRGGPFTMGDAGERPRGFSWDDWLGPAPMRPYHQRYHKGGWLHFWDFSGGELVAETAHQMDLAHMLLDEPGMPRSVSSAGGRLAHRGDDSEMPDLLVSSFEFDDFVMTLEHSNYPEYMMKTTTSIRQGNEFPFWMHNSTRIELYGSKQMMVVGRHGGGWQATIYPWEVLAQEYGRTCDDEHYADFIQCLKSRKRPNADIETLHPSVSMLYMAAIAHRTGNRKLKFDAAAERFDDAAANALLTRAYRDGYALPTVS